MSVSILLPWFFSLFCLAVAWIGLVLWTFHRLRVRHPSVYEDIGSPSLFWNNSMRHNWLFCEFLFQGGWCGLGDAKLAKVANVMRVIFVVYMLGFFGLLIVFVVAGIGPVR